MAVSISINQYRFYTKFIRVASAMTDIMPQVYLKKEQYDEIVRRKWDATRFVEEAVKEKLWGKKPA